MKRTPITKDLTKKSDELYIEVTEKEYKSSLAKGLDPESLLKPGCHKFMRGGFKKLHPNFDPKNAKVQIDTPLDQDIYQYLHQRAGLAEGEFDADSISAVLRELIELDKAMQAPAVVNLLADPRFTKLLDQRITAQLAKQKRKRKAA
jgi:hypothetical protein